MNRTVFSCDKSVFVNYECIKGYSFKTVISKGNCALFAKNGRILMAHFDINGMVMSIFNNKNMLNCFEQLIQDLSLHKYIAISV